MKEEYVTYEQSQALKRLGFAEKVNHAYLKKISIEPELSVGDLKKVHSEDPKNYNDNRKDAGKGLFFYSAPRLDQAQKWLREQCGIHISANPYSDTSDDADGNKCDEWHYWSFELMHVPNGDFFEDSKGEFDSYELALSAGIDAALELLTDKLNDK